MDKFVAFPPTGQVFYSTVLSPLGGVSVAGQHIDAKVGVPMTMRRWDTYALVYILRGRAHFEDESGIKRPVGVGDLLLMFPRYGYRYVIPEHELWSEIFIQFRGPLFGLWLKERLLDPRRPIHHLEPLNYWRHRLEAIAKPLAMPEPTQSLKRLCLLQEFLVDGVLTPRNQPSKNALGWLVAARAALEEDLGTPMNWDQISGQFGLSYQRFRKKFSQLGGVPPAAYRAGKVIEYAETLLQSPRLSLGDIAQQCGFCDEFHFAKRFKELTGLTPAQFRSRFSDFSFGRKG